MRIFLASVSSFLFLGCVLIQTKGDPQFVMGPAGDRGAETRLSQIYVEPSTQRDLSKASEVFQNYFTKLGFMKVPREKLAILDDCSIRYGYGGATSGTCQEFVTPNCLEKNQTLQTSGSKPFGLRRIVCIGMLRMPTGIVFEDIDNAYPLKGEAIPMQKLTPDSLKEFQAFSRSAQEEWLAFFRIVRSNIDAKKLGWVRISKWYPESKNSKSQQYDVSDRVIE